MMSKKEDNDIMMQRKKGKGEIRLSRRTEVRHENRIVGSHVTVLIRNQSLHKIVLFKMTCL